MGCVPQLKTPVRMGMSDEFWPDPLLICGEASHHVKGMS